MQFYDSGDQYIPSVTDQRSLSFVIKLIAMEGDYSTRYFFPLSSLGSWCAIVMTDYGLGHDFCLIIRLFLFRWCQDLTFTRDNNLTVAHQSKDNSKKSDSGDQVGEIMAVIIQRRGSIILITVCMYVFQSAGASNCTQLCNLRSPRVSGSGEMISLHLSPPCHRNIQLLKIRKKK